MNRRQFSVEAALALLGGASVVISGCGGGSSSPSTVPLQDSVGTVSSNHGHAAVVTAAELGSNGALNLDIRGTASHSHTVTLSTTEIAAIRAGGRVEKESSGNSHTHTVTFNV
jgi:hypothetical protein